jgi:DNA anti-recombination protein RmuC
MSAKVDKFCENLKERLNTLDTRLSAAKTSVQALPGKAEKAVRDQYEKVHRKVQSQKERIDQLRSKLKTGAERKLAETKESVAQLKAKREAQLLNARAEGAESYAAYSVEYAAAAIDEAEEAILDAVIARLDADEVAAH